MARRQEIYQPRRIVGDSIESLRFQLQEELDRIGEVIIQLAEMKYLPQAEQPPKYDDGSLQFFVDGVSVDGIASTAEGLHQFRNLNWFRLLDDGNLAKNGGTITEENNNNTFAGTQFFENPIILDGEVWNTPTLQNGWENYSTTPGFAHAAYRKLPSGQVVVRGLIKSGTDTTGTVLFNLPAGYRTGERLIITTSSGSAWGRIDVHPNGDVAIQNGSATWLAINFSFFADQ